MEILNCSRSGSKVYISDLGIGMSPGDGAQVSVSQVAASSDFMKALTMGVINVRLLPEDYTPENDPFIRSIEMRIGGKGRDFIPPRPERIVNETRLAENMGRRRKTTSSASTARLDTSELPIDISSFVQQAVFVYVEEK